MREEPTVVIGAGAGGLAAAITLASEGRPVLVLDRMSRPGGKMRNVSVDGLPIPAGPTVLTMRWAFDALLERAGLRLDDLVTIRRSDVLARHAWTDGRRLDLYADVERSVDAIGEFAGAADARSYRDFVAEAQRIHGILLDTHMRAQRPSFFGLMGRIGLRRFPDMMALRPYTSLTRALTQRFRDPRLVQLLGRYATYTGSSPYTIPATLMLVSHVEREGVWRIEGGMAALADALRGAAERLGVRFQFDADVARVEMHHSRAAAVRLRNGERIRAADVVACADASAMGTLAPEAGVRTVSQAKRSHSAITYCVRARTRFPLAHHTVFFSSDYEREFTELRAGRVPHEPTTYVCAPDRDDAGDWENDAPADGERMLMLVNAPANGDTNEYGKEAELCEQRMVTLLERCGMKTELRTKAATTPNQFASMFPHTGGALYGRINDGPFAGFSRPGAATRIPNLALAGGSCHPGPGVPMSTISGMLAAEHLMAARASTRRSRPAATFGGTSTASATTAAMPSP